MSLIWWISLIVAAGLILVVGPMLYLALVLAWEDQRTRGVRYYGLAPAERDAFKRTLRTHARLLSPVIRVASRLNEIELASTGFEFEGVAGPKGTCSPESFASGNAYEPRPEDVFVVTQMKCGTTWMQHLVYEILMRGSGDLVDSGRTLYAVSPWLESLKSVSLADAPLVGAEQPSRIIKTHFPTSLCPYGPGAKYVYVARHPVSCFASSVDFITANLGVFTPGLDEIERWFCSEEHMWWGPWPDHVAGWLERSRCADNVLFVQFEDMKSDLPGVVRRVAAFLGMRPLNDLELANVLEKCGFAYMQLHSGTFEMHPPHVLAVNAALFVRGAANRHQDVPPEVRDRILEWCASRSAEKGLLLDELYPTGDGPVSPS